MDQRKTSGSSEPGRSTSRFDLLEQAGRSSSLVKDVRSLSRDGPERRRRGLVVAEGIRLVEEAMKNPGRIRAAIVSDRIVRTDRGRAIAEAVAGGTFLARRVADSVLADISDLESHQGILLLVERPSWDLRGLLSAGTVPLVLVACGVQDPGNLGALARVAEAAFATGLVCAGPGADPFSPRALRGSAGALLRIPVVEIADPVDAARSLREAGLKLIGSSPAAATGYREAPLEAPSAIFLGSEGAGLGSSLEGTLDTTVRIPMREGVESLNVAAAAAVLLFEAASRRGHS